MKKLFFLAVFLSTKILFCQDEIPLLHIDSLYEDKTEYLLHSKKVILEDSVGKAQIIQRIKNWSGTKFINPSEVLVNETQDQLVYNYIKSLELSNVTFNWYIRLIISVKDDKVRLQYYDDGNAYYTIGTTATPARSSHLKGYYIKEGGLYPRKIANTALTNFKTDVKMDGLRLEEYIKNPSNQNKGKKDDW